MRERERERGGSRHFWCYYYQSHHCLTVVVQPWFRLPWCILILLYIHLLLTLIRMGAHVTCVTVAWSKALFSDGYDDGVKPGDDDQHHFIQLKRNGSKTLTDLIVSNANQGRPFTCRAGGGICRVTVNRDLI